VTVLPAARRETAWHESYHAASLCLSGLVPELVRIDQPTNDDAGFTVMDWENHRLDKDTATEMLVGVLMGPLAEGDLKHDFTWPIKPDEWQVGVRRDAKVARLLADFIGLDHVGWTWVLYRARSRAKDRRFRRLVVAIATALELKEILFKHELEELAQGIEETP
jgi:hypothetical protein